MTLISISENHQTPCKGKARLLEYGCSEIYRSSCLQVFFKIGVLKNFTAFIENHLCWSLIHRSFPVIIVKVLRTAFFYRTPLMAASGFLIKLAENNCEENHSSVVEFFSEISQKLFLSLGCSISKNNSFTGFSEFLSFFKHAFKHIQNPVKHQDGAYCERS